MEPPIAPSTSSEALPPIDPTAREALLGFLLAGLGPHMACTRSGLVLPQFFEAYETDDEFHERVEQVRDALGWNVASVLYKAAIEGSVTAMTSWLKLRPPRDWNPNDDFTNTDDVIESLEGFEVVGSSDASGTALPPEASGMFPPPSM